MVKSKQVSEQANFTIKNVPQMIYHKLNTGYYKNFNKKYQLEVVSIDTPLLKEIFTDLLEYIKKDISAPIPKDSEVKITLGIYTRTASTYINPPPNNCGMRLLFNLGYGDVYKLNPKYTDSDGDQVDSGLTERSVYLDKDKYLILGPSKTSKYKIEVSDDTTVSTPGNNPGDSPIPRLRVRDYRRIVIIIDYLIAQDTLDSLINVVNDLKIPSIKIKPGTGKKDIEAHIKKVQQTMTSKNEEAQKSQQSQIVPENQGKMMEDFEQSVLDSIKSEDKDAILKEMENIG